jgi:ADP-ribose pyrophosphatase YjhB (NUDIX family)
VGKNRKNEMRVNYNKEDTKSHDGVAAVIKNENGDILMQEHVKYGFWTIPVGKVKRGQSILSGLKEEIFEECNIKILRYKKIANKNYFYERDGIKVRVAAHLYDILEYSGEIKNLEPHKHKQQIFLPIKKIIQLPYISDLTLLFLKHNGIKREAHF